MTENVPHDLVADITGGGHLPADHLLIYEDRVEYVKPGLLWGRERRVIRLEDIESVEVSRRLASARLWIMSAGGNIFMDNIGHGTADRTAELISEWRTKSKRNISQSTARIPDQIRQLAELRDSGVITENEFQEKKGDLLRRM